MEADLRKPFGRRVKELRKKRRWTQKELALKIDVNTPTLNKYECGIHMPPIEKLVALSAILDISVDYLLTGKSPSQEPVNSARLLERFKSFEELAAEDQDAILRLVDAVIVKHRVGLAFDPIKQKVG